MKNFELTSKSKELAIKSINKYKKIIEVAKQKGLNESDTSNIINDMLGEILGYDKFFDVTTEYRIRGQYCDYGVKIDNKLTFLIEVKGITIDLNSNHIFQATSYAGNEGIKYVVLTNLKKWRLYYLSFGKKVDYDLILEVDLLEDNSSSKILDSFKYFHKESFIKGAVEELFLKTQAFSNKNIQKILLSPVILKKIQAELKTLTGLKLEVEEVEAKIKDLIAK
ncbi:MAG: type I restriction enzyme HsdR N-terminal domain-containing protein [Candidatus Gracilibacteria bacterium]|nr:type I restriction enzyme HsdR N-terminal domain-containing protein [Candidatus Gracilibacteria bacterium]